MAGMTLAIIYFAIAMRNLQPQEQSPATKERALEEGEALTKAHDESVVEEPAVIEARARAASA